MVDNVSPRCTVYRTGGAGGVGGSAAPATGDPPQASIRPTRPAAATFAPGTGEGRPNRTEMRVAQVFRLDPIAKWQTGLQATCPCSEAVGSRGHGRSRGFVAVGGYDCRGRGGDVPD